eukprot:1156516-Pelagomonas_calceolata.AAC.1
MEAYKTRIRIAGDTRPAKWVGRVGTGLKQSALKVEGRSTRLEVREGGGCSIEKGEGKRHQRCPGRT